MTHRPGRIRTTIAETSFMADIRVIAVADLGHGQHFHRRIGSGNPGRSVFRPGQ